LGRYYVGNREIHAYLKAVAQKHGAYKYIRFNHKLVSAVWNEELGLWELALEVGDPKDPEKKTYLQRTCNVLINAGGLLNNWKWPSIPGLTSFKGHMCHSASWKDYEWDGANIAIIGSGSSAIQIVPASAPVSEVSFCKY
jgi:cation diffusion facilitator CzcD-associated flavoprotein CzcO